MTKYDKTADLLKVLGHTPSRVPLVGQVRTPETPTPPAPANTQPIKRTPVASVHAGSRGRAIHLYLHPEDEKLIRELSVWLSPHRKRINDSLVIKAVLRTARTGAPLLAGYDDALLVDGRFRSKKHSHQSG